MSLINGKINILSSGSLIYEAGDDVKSISYIKKGKVLQESEFGDDFINSGNFIGYKDLYTGFYASEYTAETDCEIMVFSCNDGYSLVDFLQSNPQIQIEYGEEICNLMKLIFEDYSLLYNEITNIYESVVSTHKRYVSCCEESDLNPSFFLMPHEADLFKFSDQDFFKNYNVFLTLLNDTDKLKKIFSDGDPRILKLQLDTLNSMYTTYEDMIYYLKSAISLFASNSNESLFCIASNLVEKARSSVRPSIMSLLTDMKQIISEIDESIKNTTGIILDIDYNRVNFYFMMASSVPIDDETTVIEEEPIDEPFADDLYFNSFGTLNQLCSFGDVDITLENTLNNCVLEFLSLSDKSSREESARDLRKNFMESYFKLYEAVFIKYAENPQSSNILIKLFLDFGFLDERLLTDSQIEFISHIKPMSQSSPCNIYRMKDWLMEIYHGKKLPSKSEFDVDYIDMIREKKRTENLSPKAENEMMNDRVAMVKYEIHNLIKYNVRLLSGNITSFYPMLHLENFYKEIQSILLTGEMINTEIQNVLDIDFSLFYREQMYENSELGIQKLLVQKEVFPDVLILPIYGNNAMMWQDISGKKSDTPGRILFPAFFEGRLDDITITILGRFRWELCKTMMGGAWNNISLPSLTSEFSDYIQFYRKDKNLTAEKKESIKLQISRCRNNSKEVFATDYFIWIKYESTGASRLNKVSRQILATYCPFSKSYRDKLSKNPLISDAMKKYHFINQKKTKEWYNKITSYKKQNIDIPADIVNTFKFYSAL